MNLRMGRSVLFALAGLVLAAAPALAAGDPAKDLEKAANALDAKGMLKAIGELGEKGDEKSVQMIVTVALNADQLGDKKKHLSPEEVNEIFDASKKAIIQAKDPKAHKFVFESLKTHKDWKVREVLVDAIATKQGDDADDALVIAVSDKVSTVAGTAIRALAARRCPKAFDAIIAVLEKTEKKRDEPWLDAQSALVSMTGNKDIAKSADWKNWWKSNKETYDPKKVPTGTHGVGETVAREAPKLFGLEVLSKRVVFILDVSGSMTIKDTPPENGKRGKSMEPGDPGYGDTPIECMRMKRLQDAMEKCIEQLPEDARFSIVTFSSQVIMWKQELVPANAKNKAEAIEFSKGMHAEGYTWTDTALERAFDFADANTFYLFTDGIPQRGKNPDGSPQMIPHQEVLDKTIEWNRIRKVKINCIGIGEADPTMLAKLASAHDGTCVMVPAVSPGGGGATPPPGKGP
jgi:hypothetical protein